MDAVVIFLFRKYHLAIVDIMMPRMDGITMMMKVREKGYEFPVIMLSAKSEEVDKIMGLNMGECDMFPCSSIPLFHPRRYPTLLLSRPILFYSYSIPLI